MTAAFLAKFDETFDNLLAKLGCNDSTDAVLMSHWQEGTRPGFRIQVTRRADGKALTKFVGTDCVVRP